MLSLEAKEGPSFKDGYFTAYYEVAMALPPPFDLQATLNWDRDQIMAKAAQLLGSDPDREVAPENVAHLDPFLSQGSDLPIDI